MRVDTSSKLKQPLTANSQGRTGAAGGARARVVAGGRAAGVAVAVAHHHPRQRGVVGLYLLW